MTDPIIFNLNESEYVLSMLEVWIDDSDTTNECYPSDEPIVPVLERMKNDLSTSLIISSEYRPVVQIMVDFFWDDTDTFPIESVMDSIRDKVSDD